MTEKESRGKGLEERESQSKKHAENSESDRHTERDRERHEGTGGRLKGQTKRKVLGFGMSSKDVDGKVNFCWG